MAKTSTMTPAECEALIGVRGGATINSLNRNMVKKWLTSQGFPSLFCVGLSIRELTNAYNDLSGAGIEALRVKLAKGAEDGEDALPENEAQRFEEEKARVRAEGFDLPETQKGATPSPSVPAASPAADSGRLGAIIAAALAAAGPGIDVNALKAEILADLGGKTLSEKAVREIIANEVPNHVATIKIEVKEGPKIQKSEGLRHSQFKELLEVVAQGLPVMIVGPAGSGKTTAAEQVAEALGAEFPFYLEGGVFGAHQLTGYKDAAGVYHTTPYRQAFQYGGVFCKDEMDVDDPAATLTLNAGLANGVAPFPDSASPLRRHDNFRFIGTANTFGQGADRLYVGRNQLDAATLDRFYFIEWRYDEKLERMAAGNESWVDRVQALRAGAAKEKARIVISPRASIYGARMIAAGASFNQCEQALIWKGCDGALRSRIEAAAKH